MERTRSLMKPCKNKNREESNLMNEVDALSIHRSGNRLLRNSAGVHHEKKTDHNTLHMTRAPKHVHFRTRFRDCGFSLPQLHVAADEKL